MAKKKKKYSRFSPTYLASRHGGPLFLFLALGVLGGMAYRTLVLPTRYHARTEVAVQVVPPEAAGAVDWNARQAEWRGILETHRDQGLLCVNLRHALKLAATQDLLLDIEDFASTLAAFDPGATYSSILFNNRYLARFESGVTVSRRDLAMNMDFHSLAAVVADLDPPRDGSGDWDFSFFATAPAESVGSGVIVDPGPEDHFFRVFYRLHEILRGRPAVSPMAAWNAAAEEVAARLDREADFSGGGGFGPIAKREIVREITAIPMTAANGLYRINRWFTAEAEADGNVDTWVGYWEKDADVSLRHLGASRGELHVSMDTLLNPVAYRRDTVYTRLPPLAAATMASFIIAREGAASPIPVEAPSSGATNENAADYVAELEPLESATTADAETAKSAETTEVTYREVIDDVAAKQRLSLIAMHEESVNMARVERDAAVRRLNASRDAENRLSHEALAARSRADRLQERYDAAVQATEADGQPTVPPATAKLFAQRDEVFARLTTLLQYCTEEHPFVRQARRDLDMLETQLAGHSPDAEANRAAEARATRMANLYLEWETAVDQADSLEERSRRQSEDARRLLDAVTEYERCISQREMELAQAKESPIPIIRQEIPAVRTAVVVSTPRPVVAAPAPTPQPSPAVLQARLVFDPIPARIPLEKYPPDWRPVLLGMLAGLCLGLLWTLLSELLASRFQGASDARRLVGLPVLASLPAYDPRSFRAAAATMKGEVIRAGAGRYRFVPALVEFSEPPTEARRGKVHPLVRRPRFLVWAFGLLFLLLAGLLYYRSLTGFAQPPLAGSDELPLPGTAVRAWAEEGERWGNLP